ncbi:DUF952 domain-containing protein [uncultured Litoreibacter sp.]|uniref:DUF952 domain-containing protein n=1 Tax=uncultured Litoreibacter sp. TaxID=1392394 RepID=UPI00261DE19D|nr:DUF952 domain-containing protein [uncultured Litoreibacter sp.]
MLIYKILTRAQWAEFEQNGAFKGAPIDLADGFIHFSTASQARETAAKHFAGQDGLYLAWGDADAMGGALKWEVSRGGDQFPHLYRDWPMSEVLGHAELPLKGSHHQFPEGIA